jgi:hypothetical protein
MISSLELENFKAFSTNQKIPFAPITLIFGANSAGKSSILQAVYLLTQSRRQRSSAGVLTPRSKNGIVDLGNYSSFIFNHEIQRNLRIRVGIGNSWSVGQGGLRQIFSDSRELGMTMEFSTTRPKDTIHLESFTLDWGKSSEFAAKFIDNRTIRPDDLEPNPPADEFEGTAINQYAADSFATCSSFQAPNLLDTTIPETFEAQCAELLKRLDWELQSLSPDYKDDSHLSNLSAYISSLQSKNRNRRGISEEIWKESLTQWIHLLSSQPTPTEVREKLIDDYIGYAISFDGFIPCMTQPVFNELSNLLSCLQIPNLGACACIAGFHLQDLLERVISIGPYRNPPSRWYYQATDQSLQSETNGTSIPAYLFENPKIVKETNRFLKALEIQYSIAPRSLGNQESGLFELRLRDLYRKKSVYVGLSDVGYGLSQILPVVVESIAASHRIILIEQPELHIHPKLQADLADMFIYGCGEYNNQYILETHSEHLMLRLLRRVREGKISPEMLSVIYVSRGPFGSVVHSVRIDKNGDFMDDFPGGFFPERLDELL